MKRINDDVIESYMEHLDPDFRLEHRKQIEKDIETVKQMLDTGNQSVIMSGNKKGE
jgi:hypothetical protein